MGSQAVQGPGHLMYLAYPEPSWERESVQREVAAADFSYLFACIDTSGILSQSLRVPVLLCIGLWSDW